MAPRTRISLALSILALDAGNDHAPVPRYAEVDRGADADGDGGRSAPRSISTTTSTTPATSGGDQGDDDDDPRWCVITPVNPANRESENMNRMANGTLLLGVAALALQLTACGPTRVLLSPNDVASVTVRPASGQLVYCPGDPFQIELLATLKNGTTCSSTDRRRGCLAEKDAVIDAQSVRVSASNGSMSGDPQKFLWTVSEDPLATAATGVALRGWIERDLQAGMERSPAGDADLKPVYECQSQVSFGGGSAGNRGESGAPGPDLDIAVTTLATPFYPTAALIRVTEGTTRRYYISPSPDRPVKITSAAVSGGSGAQGENGKEGTAGRDASEACAKGGNGDHGTHGLNGGNGGNGGSGGTIRIRLDAGAADRLRGRVLAVSYGGEGGAAGSGGVGGKGGAPGHGGPSASQCASGGNVGDPGHDGQTGRSGQAGSPGASGPQPAFTTASRAALFGTEIAAIKAIEASPARR